MSITAIVIVVLVIAALVALGIHLNERRKKLNKAKHLASKIAHPAGSVVPPNAFKADKIVQDTISVASITRKDSFEKKAEYVAPTFRKKDEPTSFLSSKAQSYKSRYDDNYYPSNAVTDAVLLSALISSESEPVRTTYEPAVSSSDTGTSGSYSSSHDSNGSSGGYSSSDSGSSSFSFD